MHVRLNRLACSHRWLERGAQACMLQQVMTQHSGHLHPLRRFLLIAINTS